MDTVAAILGIPLLVTVVEMILAAKWNRTYFMIGLPLYRQIVVVQRAYPRLPPTDAFEARFGSAWEVSLLFRQFGPGEFAFREELLVFKLFAYRTIMHGIVQYDVGTSRVIVTGYANWSFLAFVIWALIVTIGTNPLALIFVGIALGVISLLIYAVQASRYNEVAEFAAYRWSNPGPGQLNGA